MKGQQRPLGFIVVLALGLALILGSGFPQSASAASEDVAIFYDDLSQYGQWVDYENYGPVWRPTNVGENWRPYTDGRWVPTNDGYVFESQEPWGWATYHYGNWMPSADYGWLWCPGSTWYPSTCEWRTSDSYYGWAPIPPPGYGAVAETAFVFAEAANFLLGFEQPFAPSYSYSGCGCLAPVSYYPTIFPATALLTNFFAPAFAPRGPAATCATSSTPAGPAATWRCSATSRRRSAPRDRGLRP